MFVIIFYFPLWISVTVLILEFVQQVIMTGVQSLVNLLDEVYDKLNNFKFNMTNPSNRLDDRINFYSKPWCSYLFLDKRVCSSLNMDNFNNFIYYRNWNQQLWGILDDKNLYHSLAKYNWVHVRIWACFLYLFHRLCFLVFLFLFTVAPFIKNFYMIILILTSETVLYIKWIRFFNWIDIFFNLNWKKK